jgi:hypothetical protein
MTLIEKYRNLAKEQGNLLDFDASAEYLESRGYDIEDAFQKYDDFCDKNNFAYGKTTLQIKRLFRFPRKLKKQIKKMGLWEGLC